MSTYNVMVKSAAELKALTDKLSLAVFSGELSESRESELKAQAEKHLKEYQINPGVKPPAVDNGRGRKPGGMTESKWRLNDWPSELKKALPDTFKTAPSGSVTVELECGGNASLSLFRTFRAYRAEWAEVDASGQVWTVKGSYLEKVGVNCTREAQYLSPLAYAEAVKTTIKAVKAAEAVKAADDALKAAEADAVKAAEAVKVAEDAVKVAEDAVKAADAVKTAKAVKADAADAVKTAKAVKAEAVKAADAVKAEAVKFIQSA